jgi:hypothetical protein
VGVWKLPVMVCAFMHPWLVQVIATACFRHVCLHDMHAPAGLMICMHLLVS